MTEQELFYDANRDNPVLRKFLVVGYDSKRILFSEAVEAFGAKTAMVDYYKKHKSSLNHVNYTHFQVFEIMSLGMPINFVHELVQKRVV